METLTSSGDFIRAQREAAEGSVRELARVAGVSNPYLSQIERGLRKPSAEILQQIAKALSVSAETLYVPAALLDEGSDHHLVAQAIALVEAPTYAQRASLLDMYAQFITHNQRAAAAASTTS